MSIDFTFNHARFLSSSQPIAPEPTINHDEFIILSSNSLDHSKLGSSNSNH